MFCVGHTRLEITGDGAVMDRVDWVVDLKKLSALARMLKLFKLKMMNFIQKLKKAKLVLKR